MQITNIDHNRLLALAKCWAEQLQAGDFLALHGALGAGKTTLCQMLVRARLGEDLSVTSPTFGLMHIYDQSIVPIVHMDLYRIDDPAMIEELGMEEYLQSGIIIAEWAQKLGDWLPKTRLDVTMTIQDDDLRTLQITPQGRATMPDLASL